MRFWHIVKDENGQITEQYLVGNSNRRLSLEIGAEMLSGTYDVIPTEN
tara:strand:- start:130 stop:273 length:144 start_codon:yes stop_codon:yes gene_type:complete